jgi:hypothetical protein
VLLWAWPTYVSKRPQAGVEKKVSEFSKNSAKKLNYFALDIVFKEETRFYGEIL